MVLTQPIAMVRIPHTVPISGRIATAAVDGTGYRTSEGQLPFFMR
jgi:hypothetical protein